MAGEGTNEGVVARFTGQGELNGDGFPRVREGSVDNDVVGVLWDVVFFHRLGIGDHGGGERTDGVNLAGFDQDKVVRLLSGGVDVVEGEGNDRARFGGEFGFVVSERNGRVRFELDGHGAYFLCGCGADEGGHGEESQKGGGHGGQASQSCSQWRWGAEHFK